MVGSSLQKTVRFFLAAVFFLSATTSLQAQTRIMGNDIMNMDLIVFADVSLRDTNSSSHSDSDRINPDSNFAIVRPWWRDFEIKTLEVLKGDASLVGKIFNIKLPPEGDAYLDRRNVKVGQQIVLFRKGVENDWILQDGYTDESIPGFRCLADIFRTKPDIAQARKIMDLAQNAKGVCPQTDWVAYNFINALYALRDKEIFSIVENALPKVPPDVQKEILRWMRTTGDLRAVPVLLRYIDSPDSELRFHAIAGLTHDFPGATGVTNAFLDKWKKVPDVRGYMLEYLSKRVSDPDVDRIYQGQLRNKPFVATLRDNLRKALRDGSKDEAKKYCAQLVANAAINDSDRISMSSYFGADCMVTFISPEEQDKYIPSKRRFIHTRKRAERAFNLFMMRARRPRSILQTNSALNTQHSSLHSRRVDKTTLTIPMFANYLEKQIEMNSSFQSAKDVLRAALSVKHPALIRVLMAFLKKGDMMNQNLSLDEKLSVVSAIRGYGKDASDIAAKDLLSQLDESRESSRFLPVGDLWQIIALVWVGTDQDINAMRQKILESLPPEVIGLGEDTSYSRSVTEYRNKYIQLAASLKPVSEIPDETAFWIEMIKNRSKFPGEYYVTRLSIARLGLLRDARAVPVLMELLEDDKAISFKEDVYRALAIAGNPGIEQLKSLALKLDSSQIYYSEMVVDALCKSEKEALLPFLRQWVKNSKFDSIPFGLWRCFEQYGAADNIAFLVPYADYWKYGGKGSYGTRNLPQETITAMREKYEYDITGPIQKRK